MPFQPKDVSLLAPPKPPQRRLYRLVLTRDCPFDFLTLGGQCVSKRTTRVTVKSDGSLGPDGQHTGTLAYLSDEELERVERDAYRTIIRRDPPMAFRVFDPDDPERHKADRVTVQDGDVRAAAFVVIEPVASEEFAEWTPGETLLQRWQKPSRSAKRR